jgi:acetyltransferase-like isoleucine patch superfamily enzyme
MPIDRHHAFASGRVYAPPSLTVRLTGRGAAAAWRAFERCAEVGTDVMLGRSAWCANSGPRERVRVGDRVVCRGILRRELFGDGLLEIGDDVYIGDDCIVSCSEHVTIGNGTLLGHGVQIFDNNSHPVDPAARKRDWSAIRGGGAREKVASAPVTIGEHAWIGFGAFVLKGVTIGDAAIVGAGSVVTRDVAGGSVVAGNPAQPINSPAG